MLQFFVVGVLWRYIDLSITNACIAIDYFYSPRWTIGAVCISGQ